jgi:predicted nucleic-acid-binding Zn-ribbon protein
MKNKIPCPECRPKSYEKRKNKLEVNHQNDINYFQKNLYIALKIPVQYITLNFNI